MCITNYVVNSSYYFLHQKHLCFNTPYLPFECHMPYLTTMAAATHPAPKQSGNSERWNGGIEIILVDLGNWWSYGRRIGVPWCFSAQLCWKDCRLTSKFLLEGYICCYQLTVNPTYILLPLVTFHSHPSFSKTTIHHPSEVLDGGRLGRGRKFGRLIDSKLQQMASRFFGNRNLFLKKKAHQPKI